MDASPHLLPLPSPSHRLLSLHPALAPPESLLPSLPLLFCPGLHHQAPCLRRHWCVVRLGSCCGTRTSFSGLSCYSRMMQTNFIGAFVLTNLLLPLLKFSPVPSKIVNVTSFTHRCISNTDLNEGTLGAKIFDCLPTSGSYPSARTYELSKFCLLLFSYELHRQLHLVDPSLNISVMCGRNPNYAGDSSNHL
ncbi:Protochlorophyllide reductase protein [Dioscorea alata]|uniref:Protochlorophyllide reductase protein n=1 Tax=Dioscorea alata TaxID=55571 RepID=A0ACB7TSY6_DIOAL|nr:Protochlorophyllide reductase protein [Dioscorea alata]